MDLTVITMIGLGTKQYIDISAKLKCVRDIQYTEIQPLGQSQMTSSFKPPRASLIQPAMRPDPLQTPTISDHCMLQSETKQRPVLTEYYTLLLRETRNT